MARDTERMSDSVAVKKAEALGDRLQHASIALMERLSARDYNHPIFAQLMSPDFEMTMAQGCDEISMRANTLVDSLQNMRKRATTHANYKFAVTSSCAEVFVAQQKATVWITCKVVVSVASNNHRCDSSLMITGMGEFE
jgi:hypothetical protein